MGHSNPTDSVALISMMILIYKQLIDIHLSWKRESQRWILVL
jgi:hypothetical protein